MIPLQIIHSFHDHGKMRECFGTLFFWIEDFVLSKNRRESQSDHSVFSAIYRNFFWSRSRVRKQKLQKFAKRSFHYFCNCSTLWFARARTIFNDPCAINPSVEGDREGLQGWDTRNLQSEPPSNKYRSEVEGCRTKKKET